MSWARIPGTNHNGSFILTAHYDSVYSGPGAGDDGSGVITMLETARALMAGPRLQNDIIFAFTGDEERGSQSIRAFTRHPWAQNAGVVLGLEGRGCHGPSYMFETSPRNYWLIRQLCRAGVNPRANSLMYEVHRRTPNGTDYGAIKNDGFPGYNVSFVGGLCYYHSANDTPGHLSPASIQHHGSYALGLARYFGNMPAAEFKKARQADSDAVYANVVGSWLVCYPARYGRPIAWIAGAVFVAAVGSRLLAPAAQADGHGCRCHRFAGGGAGHRVADGRPVVAGLPGAWRLHHLPGRSLHCGVGICGPGGGSGGFSAAVPAV